MKTKILSLIISLSYQICSFGQVKSSDTIKIDYKRLYSFCLDADIPSALKCLKLDTTKVSDKDRIFIENFTDRFISDRDKSSFIIDHHSSIDSLLSIFHSYWRSSLTDPSKIFDSVFVDNLNVFFSKEFLNRNIPSIQNDSLDSYFNKYIKLKKLYATDGIGKTGKLYDLLVWKTQKDTTYTFSVYNEIISANVVLMSDFITLGWEDYATLGRFYPGGWATDKSLYCVAKAYDLNSEDFLVSYLAHEGRHFKDYKSFPKLKNSADLEYRAKLTELSLAKKTLYKLIEFFIINANDESTSGHQIANYCVIRDLSKELFKNNFEKNIEKWKITSA